MKYTFKQRLSLWLAYGLCWLFHKSYRYVHINPERFDKALAMSPTNGYAIASWHQNLFAGVLSHGGKKLNLLVSPSFDGELITFVANKLKIGAVRGSSSRGGKEALRGLIRKVKAGEGVAFTVDGPKGPPHKVKSGIISCAHRTGIPVLPLATIGEKYWSLRSWDKFRLPKPFSRVAVFYDEPYIIPKDLDDEGWETQKKILEEKLTKVDSLAHEFFV